MYISTQVPIFELHDDSTHLNAYCLDFFKHGQIDALEIYNKMNRDRLWEDLQSFLLVLKALTAAMQRRHSSMNEGRQTLFDDQNVLDSSNHLTIQRANATGCCLNGFQEHHSEPKTRDTPYCLRPSIYLSICGSIHHICCYLSTFVFVQSNPALPLVLVSVLLCFLCSLKVGSEGSHGLTAYMHKQMEREPN